MSNPPFESSGGQIEAAEQVQSPLWQLRGLLWGFTREQPLCAPERAILTSPPPMEVCQVRTYHSNIQTPPHITLSETRSGPSLLVVVLSYMDPLHLL